MPALESGVIVMWAGAIVDIPGGFVLCDGTLGTPDLRNRFVVGAGAAYAVGANGGTSAHLHPFTSNTHFHSLAPGPDIQAGTDHNFNTSANAATGTTNPAVHLPPYYALAFIMKT